VVFTRSDGGHIHLASKDQIPATAKELYEDLKQSFRLMQSTLSPTKQEASPMLSQSADCPDGKCPIVPPALDQANRKPLFPSLRNPINPDGNLFPSDSGAVDLNLIEGLFRRSGYSLETVLFVVAVVAGVIFYKLR
jgi:hypothetical protein